MEKSSIQVINKKTMVQQTIDYLREYILDINSGQTKLPSEGEIAGKLGVSRLTIREAMTVLENEGLIVKSQGSSTTVTTFARKLAENIDYKGELGSFIEDCGAVLDVSILESKFISLDKNISSKLEIDLDDEVFYVEKLFLADKKPAAFCINRVPKKYILDWDFDKDCIGSSMFQLVEEKSNYSFSYDEMELIPEIVTEELSHILKLDKNSPILRADVIKYSIEGIPIMYNSEYYVDEMIRFTALRNNYGLKMGQTYFNNKDVKGDENE